MSDIIDMNELRTALLAAGLPASFYVSPHDIATIGIGSANGRSVLVVGDSTGRTEDGHYIVDTTLGNLSIGRDADDFDTDARYLDTTDIDTYVAVTKEWYDHIVSGKTDAHLPYQVATIIFYFHTEVPSIVDAALTTIRHGLVSRANYHPDEIADYNRDQLITVAANTLGLPWLETNLPHYFAGFGIGMNEEDAEW